jgi:hypothetical protein
MKVKAGSPLLLGLSPWSASSKKRSERNMETLRNISQMTDPISAFKCGVQRDPSLFRLYYLQNPILYSSPIITSRISAMKSENNNIEVQCSTNNKDKN